MDSYLVFFTVFKTLNSSKKRRSGQVSAQKNNNKNSRRVQPIANSGNESGQETLLVPRFFDSSRWIRYETG